jgi:hypothetical protein
MPHYNGWFPRKRDDIIHRGDSGEGQIDLHGQAWGHSAPRIDGIGER